MPEKKWKLKFFEDLSSLYKKSIENKNKTAIQKLLGSSKSKIRKIQFSHSILKID